MKINWWLYSFMGRKKTCRQMEHKDVNCLTNGTCLTNGFHCRIWCEIVKQLNLQYLSIPPSPSLGRWDGSSGIPPRCSLRRDLSNDEVPGYQYPWNRLTISAFSPTVGKKKTYQIAGVHIFIISKKKTLWLILYPMIPMLSHGEPDQIATTVKSSLQP